MNVGMMWFDNDPRTALDSKVERAADYFKRKYGYVPNLCLVHPSMLAGPKSEALDVHDGKVIVRSNRVILPGHLWIGKEDKN